MTVAEPLIEERRGAEKTNFLKRDVWETCTSGTYVCRALLCPEEEGGYSAHSLRLPGVVSQGDTKSEAIRNIAEAFAGALETYLAEGSIPWSDVDIERSTNCTECWITVNV